MTIHKHCDLAKPIGRDPREIHAYKNTYYRNWNQHNAHE